MTTLKEGDRVKYSDVKETSIPAYRDARGTIVEVSPYYGGSVRVHWDSDSTPEPHFRDASTVTPV
jgi:hypothetical protein